MRITLKPSPSNPPERMYLRVSGPRLAYGPPHVENDLFGNLSVSHLKDVNQTHFNPLTHRKVLPVAVPYDLKRDDAIVHDAVFGREPLKGLELYIAHRGEKLPVTLGHGFLSGERPIEPVRRGRLPDDVICVQLKRRFDLILRFSVKVKFYTGQVFGYNGLYPISLSFYTSAPLPPAPAASVV